MARSRRLAGVLATAALVVTAGCQRAGRYADPRPGATPADSARQEQPGAPPEARKPPAPEPVPAEYVWQEALGPVPADTPVEFVPDSERDAWNKLTQFWTEAGGKVTIKVPLGLDDPRPFLPAANPPTLNKWKLGKLLFFDDSYLLAGGQKASCAGCHNPDKGFTSGNTGLPFNAPTLINSVYNLHQFWDGRATRLEEVVRWAPEDARAAGDEGTTFRHAWDGAGVIRRLRGGPLAERFREAFGTDATLDAVGKALATYLRTVLSGNSPHDRAALRARAERGGKPTEPADYEKVLDDATAKALRSSASKADVAKELHKGFLIFSNQGERKANCVLCHDGRQFTDNGFYNLGIDMPENLRPAPGREPGRFAALPPGHKDRSLIGAYRTPTLRALSQTGPYFHDGSFASLRDVVGVHASGGKPNRYLDPHLRALDLRPDELDALELFLRALDGDPVDPLVADERPKPR